MSSQYSVNYYGVPQLTRSTSAPPTLDSNMLFAFPVGTEYASAFLDIRNDDLYEEFYERFKEKLPVPPPLLDGSFSGKVIPEEPMRKYSDLEETQTRSRSTSFLVTNIVNNCIKDEESPKNLKTKPDFTPSFEDPYYQVFPGFTLQHIYSHALEMSKDQVGCRLLQKKLEEKNPFTIQAIYDQIHMSIPEIMVDAFGNYFIQKLIEECDETILESVVKLVKPHFTQICIDPHGTRAIQKLIEVVIVYPKHLHSVIESLKGAEVLLIKDTNGNHVIQKCLIALGYPNNDFIYQVVCNDIIDLATHRHGCCVLQRCIDAASAVQKETLINNIIDSAVQLVQDAFGNYVVQYVIDLHDDRANSRLGLIFVKNLKMLATQKFSSNVIEKCLQKNTAEIQKIMIQEISQPSNIIRMMNDQYANYVVQRALSLADSVVLSRMLKEISSRADELKKTQFGKRIYAKLRKKYPEMAEKPNGKKH